MQWEGKAIFARAFRTLLPDKDEEVRRVKFVPEDEYRKIFLLAEPRRVPRLVMARGANFEYTPGPSKYYGRAGTWTQYMVQTVLKHNTTSNANLSHVASGQYPEKRLDFNWMLQHQYITRVQ
jgi:hypothetical protein